MRIKISEETKRSLGNLHTAFLVGVISLFFIIFFLLEGPSAVLHFDVNIFLIIGFLSAITLPNLGMMISSKKLDKIKEQDDPSAMEEAVRTSYILKWACIEGPALLNILFYFANDNLIHFIIAGFLIILLFLNRPSFV